MTATVELVHWNPRRPAFRGRIGARLRVGGRVGNFGDLLGPHLARELLVRRGLDPDRPARSARLLTVGSVLRTAGTGDVVWGTGANGKTLDLPHRFLDLDVRAVRGPLTAAFLIGRGITVPPVQGDPGLLVGTLWSRAELAGDRPRRALTIVPNLNDRPAHRGRPDVLDPCSPLDDVLATIASSDLVVGSSLHAVVVAESLGIPARLVRSAVEPAFKYEDYYRGSGRSSFEPAPDVAGAVALGGEPGPRWDAQALVDAFPFDLWEPTGT